MSQRIQKIKGKFYDTGTTNKSFLLVASDLKRLGIKNFYFMLEIRDPSIVGVNPYDPNLNMDQIARIINECTTNIWYYLREVCRIKNPGGKPVSYKANRGNIAQTWCLLHGIDSWLCLPRQQGKTQSLLAALAWAYNFGTNDSNFIFINKDGSNAKENLQRLKDQLESLPSYMQFESILEEDETTGKPKIVKAVKNATSMKHPITHNKITIKSKATSYESALSLARGLSSPLLHFDEPEFTNHIKTIVENSYSTFETSARNAKENGALYGRCFSCTPGDLDTSMGQEASQLLSGTCKWTEKMYDMRYDPYNDENNEVLQYVKDNGRNSIVYIEYSYKQIGLDDNWLHKMYNAIDNPLVVKREILLQRLRGSSDSPFDQEDIEYITSSIHQPIDELYLLDHFRFDIYSRLDKRTPYLVGVDCSTGTLSDNNAITILDPYDVVPVAEFSCPYIGETLYEKLIKELVQKVIPRACVVIERNSVGDGIIDHLLQSAIAHNLYFDKDRDLVEYNMNQQTTVTSMLQRQAAMKRFYGVYTEKGSREDMMTILKRHVYEFKDNFITNNIITDISRLVMTRSGKIEAGSGFHDDSVMSYLMTLYVYYHGNNLSAFGINKGARDIKDQNEGVRVSLDEIRNSGILPESQIRIMEEQEQVRKENNYEEILREAIKKSQRESLELARRKLASNKTLDNTEDDMKVDLYEDGDIDMSFFDELNDL